MQVRVSEFETVDEFQKPDKVPPSVHGVLVQREGPVPRNESVASLVSFDEIVRERDDSFVEPLEGFMRRERKRSPVKDVGLSPRVKERTD